MREYRALSRPDTVAEATVGDTEIALVKGSTRTWRVITSNSKLHGLPNVIGGWDIEGTFVGFAEAKRAFNEVVASEMAMVTA